jgi:hypothetical protein
MLCRGGATETAARAIRVTAAAASYTREAA